jgi:hypothetical protein
VEHQQVPQARLLALLCFSRRCLARLLRAAADAVPERCNANLFEVLISQIRQDDKANVVLGKALRVLPETELLKPISDLLHRGSAPVVPGLTRPHR